MKHATYTSLLVLTVLFGCYAQGSNIVLQECTNSTTSEWSGTICVTAYYEGCLMRVKMVADNTTIAQLISNDLTSDLCGNLSSTCTACATFSNIVYENGVLSHGCVGVRVECNGSASSDTVSMGCFQLETQGCGCDECEHGKCMSGRCICDPYYFGTACDQQYVQRCTDIGAPFDERVCINATFTGCIIHADVLVGGDKVLNQDINIQQLRAQSGSPAPQSICTQYGSSCDVCVFIGELHVNGSGDGSSVTGCVNGTLQCGIIKLAFNDFGCFTDNVVRSTCFSECYMNCSMHGTCLPNGQCDCYSGYSGYLCDTQKSASTSSSTTTSTANTSHSSSSTAVWPIVVGVFGGVGLVGAVVTAAVILYKRRKGHFVPFGGLEEQEMETHDTEN